MNKLSSSLFPELKEGNHSLLTRTFLCEATTKSTPQYNSEGNCSDRNDIKRQMNFASCLFLQRTDFQQVNTPMNSSSVKPRNDGTRSTESNTSSSSISSPLPYRSILKIICLYASGVKTYGLKIAFEFMRNMEPSGEK